MGAGAKRERKSNEQSFFSRNEPFILYKISYLYYPFIGTLVCVVIGMVVSYFTEMNEPHRMDPDLLSPVIHKYISFVDEEVVNKKLMKAHRVSRFRCCSTESVVTAWSRVFLFLQNSVDINRQVKEESLALNDR